MITVCQLLHSLNIGGAEVLAAGLGERMAGESFRFVFFCLDEEGVMADRLRERGFVVECLGRKAGFDRACMRRIAELWRQYDVTLVQAHQYTPFFYALGARGFFGRTPPVMFTEHGRFYPDVSNWKHVLFTRLMMRSRDRVVAVGESVKRALVRYEGIPAGRIQVIYNGIKAAHFARTPEKLVAAEAVRMEQGVTPGQKVCVHIARLDTIKDHFTSMRAMMECVWRAAEKKVSDGIQGNTHDVELWIVGGGPEEAALRAFIAEHCMAAYIKMLGQRRDIPEILAAADAFILTSVSEGIPVTILEAMAADVPIISTDVGGIPEIITHGETGLLAPAGDAAALGKALYRVFYEPALAEKLVRSAHARLEERFTEEKMHAAYEAVFREMAGGAN